MLLDRREPNQDVLQHGEQSSLTQVMDLSESTARILVHFELAIFSDLLDDVTDPKRRFDGFEDLSELAVGSGFGVRYDFGLFIFRLDTGFKTHNPALEKSKRWLTELQFKKANITIGINYPF